MIPSTKRGMLLGMRVSGLGALSALALLLGGACVGDSPSPGDPCSTSRDCVIGESCVAGSCTPSGGMPNGGCAVDGDCSPGQFCDVVSGACKAIGGGPIDAGTSTPTADGGTPPDGGAGMDAGSTDAFTGICTRDEECGTPPADICFEMQCVKGCGQPMGLPCTGGQVCNMQTGRCEAPQTTCTDDSDCNPPTEICLMGTCELGCGANPMLCGQDEICDTTTGRCVMAPTPCAMDTDCMPPMTVCENTQCVPGCDQPGGVQCSGNTPYCDPMTGRCGMNPQSGCMLDADCMDPTQICVNMMCVPRCDAPGASCPSGQVCNTNSGRCIQGGLALGDTCQLNDQCTTGVCLGVNVNMTTVRTCSRPCGAQANCPLNFTCADLGGMSFCIAESVFSPPANFDTRAGGSCSMSTNTCQSGWCNTSSNQCLETCQRDSHCGSFGGRCWMYEQSASGGTNWQQLCIAQPGSNANASCTANSGCNTGICNRYSSTCAEHCCSDSDCPSNQNCGVYDLDSSTIVKICAPARGGSSGLGASCTQSSDCASEVCAPTDPTQMNSPRRCSTTCCTDADCSVLPRGGTCTAFNGPITDTLVGLCVPN